MVQRSTACKRGDLCVGQQNNLKTDQTRRTTTDRPVLTGDRSPRPTGFDFGGLKLMIMICLEEHNDFQFSKKKNNFNFENEFNNVTASS